MTENIKTSSNLLARLNDLLKRKPNTHDVVFCVGPDEKMVKGLKVILKAASPIFEKEFEEKWEVALLKEGQGIPMPEFNAEAFEIFMKLLMNDTWSSETLAGLNLPLNQVLNLLTICKRFGMTTGQRNLEIHAKHMIRTLGTHSKGLQNFVGLTPVNMEDVIASDDLAMEELKIYTYLCRWAERMSVSLKVDPTLEMLRQIMGDFLFEIRFPSMSVTDFTTAIEFSNLLTKDETLEIYKFIGLKDSEKKKVNCTKSGFKTKPRKLELPNSVPMPLELSTLRLTEGCDIAHNPPFICDGSQKHDCFAPKERIALYGLGFLGPIKEDAHYFVKVEIKSEFSYEMKDGSEARMDEVFAKKGSIFYIRFDKPIILEPRSMIDWSNDYTIYYELKGPNTASLLRPRYKDVFLFGDNGEFRLRRFSNQLVEMLYKKI